MSKFKTTLRISMIAFTLVLAALESACSNPASNEKEHIDRDRLRTEALGLADAWLMNAPLANGYQQTGFDGYWRPVGKTAQIELTSQSRLIYVYSAAYDLSGEKKYLDAVRSAADFMLSYMRNPENGGWYKAVDKEGKPKNQTTHPYGYSFAIFGLSHAYRVTGDSRYLQAALETWQSGVWVGLEAAKLYEVTGRLPDRDAAWSQNPFMHLFEALLELYDNTQSPQVWADLEAMALFLQNRLIQPCGCLPEWFVGSWSKPQHGEKTSIYLGHQVEWAYLLSRAVERGLNPQFLTVANNLLDFALTNGRDKTNGGLRAKSNMKGEITDARHGWWGQAELMRASTHFARFHGRPNLWDIYQNAHLFARIHYINQELGGWTGSSPFLSGKPMQEQRQVIGYHAMAFYVEALSVH